MPDAAPPAVETRRLTVAPEEAGIRLDRYLAGMLAGRSRSQIQRLIKEGKVQVAGHEAKANRLVRGGEDVVVTLEPAVVAQPRPQPLDLDVFYEDADLVVVDKPAGMVVHPGAGHAEGTLVNALLHRVKDLSGIGGELRPGIVHRLDRGTSGLMVVAKNDAGPCRARAPVSRSRGREGVHRAGLGRRPGRTPDRRCRLDATRADRKKMSARARRARSATTRITKALQLPGVTLIHVAIATGRTHQIRVHLSAIGHPVVGDPVYGGARRRVPGDLRPCSAGAAVPARLRA